jgi:hypothetical protein
VHRARDCGESADLRVRANRRMALVVASISSSRCGRK